jgi:hypothetical protein
VAQLVWCGNLLQETLLVPLQDTAAGHSSSKAQQSIEVTDLAAQHSLLFVAHMLVLRRACAEVVQEIKAHQAFEAAARIPLLQ